MGRASTLNLQWVAGLTISNEIPDLLMKGWEELQRWIFSELRGWQSPTKAQTCWRKPERRRRSFTKPILQLILQLKRSTIKVLQANTIVLNSSSKKNFGVKLSKESALGEHQETFLLLLVSFFFFSFLPLCSSSPSPSSSSSVLVAP